MSGIRNKRTTAVFVLAAVLAIAGKAASQVVTILLSGVIL